MRVTTSVKKALTDEIQLAREKIQQGITEGEASSTEAKTVAVATAAVQAEAEIASLHARVRHMSQQSAHHFAHIFLLNAIPGKVWTYIYNDGLDIATNFATGFADTITLQYHKAFRQWVGLNTWVREDSYSYAAGQLAGTAWQFAFGFASAGCGSGWTMAIARNYNHFQSAEGVRDLGQKLYNGTATPLGLFKSSPSRRLVCR